MQGTFTPSFDGSSRPSSSVMCPSCSVLDSRDSNRNIDKRINNHAVACGDAEKSLEVGLARKVAFRAWNDGQTANEKEARMVELARVKKVNTLFKHSE